MLSLVLGSSLMLVVQEPVTLPRPAVECAAHLTDARARHNCLGELLEQAEAAMDAAASGAAEEAELADLDTGGMFGATAALEAAQSAWTDYRDAECARRGALMILSEDSRRDVMLDCQIALTRARAAELDEA